MKECLRLSLLSERYAVCRLDPKVRLPDWFPGAAELQSMTRTNDELSLVLEEGAVPEGQLAERSWRAFKVEGPLDFAMIGVMARLSTALSEAGVSLFAISTYDTDYVLVKEDSLLKAKEALAKVALVD